MTIVDHHRRIQESLLSRPERRVLLWLAARMPGWVTPDHLTAIGVIGAALVLLGYWLSRFQPGFLWLAAAGYIVNWFGDSLDGTLARYRHHERPRYGFFLDHTVDVVCLTLMFLGIGVSPYADFRLAACALISYTSLAQLSYINMIVTGEFRISGGKVGPTETRVIGIAAAAALYFVGGVGLMLPVAGFVTWLDILLAIITVFFLGLFTILAIQLAAPLAKLEPRPRR